MHITTEILGKTVHADTLYFAWACMALILLVSAYLVSSLSEDTENYGTKQHLAESIYDFIRGLTNGQIGEKHGEKFVYFIGSIFLFVLVSYYAGLLPWKLGSLFAWWPTLPAAAGEHAHAWHGASPCADLNVTAGIAILVVVVYFGAGVMVGGFKYIQMFFPINFGKKGISINAMCLIELMDLVVRPLTLSLRLFANTVAGETLLATFIALVALALPVGILGFEMAVGLLQAFLFTILTTVYIGSTVQHAEHLVHDEHH